MMPFVFRDTGVLLRGVLVGCVWWMLAVGAGQAQTHAIDAPMNCSLDGLYPVTTTLEADLINAVTQANAEICHPFATVVLLPNTTYTLTAAHHSDPTTGDSAFPLITGQVILDGGGSTLVVTDLNFRLASVAVSGGLTLQQVTATGGANHSGGLVYNEGTLTIQNSTLKDSTSSGDGGIIYSSGFLDVRQSALQQASSVGSGGLIYSSGTATIASSTLRDSNSLAHGGAIYSSGSLTIQDSTLQASSSTLSGGLLHATADTTIETSLLQNSSSDAQGGAIYSSGAFILRDSVLRSATSLQAGGAIYSTQSASSLLLERSQIEDSAAGDAGGAIFSQTATTLRESSLLRNVAADGGGLAMRGGTPEIALTVENSLFADNVAEPVRNPAGNLAYGGAIDATNTRLLLLNTTLTRNQSELGGALYSASGSTRIAFSTLTENRSTDIVNGAQVMAPGNAAASVKASIFEGRGHRNCLNVSSADFNVSDDSTCGGQASDVLQTVPYLTPLQDNGGAVLTRLPLAISAAVNRVPAVACTYDHDLNSTTAEIMLTRDARGSTRPVDAACDSGAVEGAQLADYDLNDDGLISPVDAIIAVNATGGTDMLADVNLDGVVDVLDVDLIRARLGTTP